MERLRPYFPKSRGRTRVDDRRVLSGITFINRNGFVAQIGLRSISPLPQTDLAYSDGTWYAKRCEAV
jgi:hypothetical protein